MHHHAATPSPQGTLSDIGQLAVWGPPAMTPQNQVTRSGLGEMTPWSGTGYLGPIGRSIQRASGLLDKMSRQEAADREKLKRREDERQASKRALDSYLVGGHIEQLLARSVSQHLPQCVGFCEWALLPSHHLGSHEGRPDGQASHWQKLLGTYVDTQQPEMDQGTKYQLLPAHDPSTHEGGTCACHGQLLLWQSDRGIYESHPCHSMWSNYIFK